MKKVFLIDDEMIIRKGIANGIDWKEEGFEYCGDAPDGEVALPLIEQCKPDIVITDIKMPFMDGLQISRILREKMPSVKIIILSGHDEFEYAREAIRIRVTEYCLKPLSASDLLHTLHKVSAQIDKEQIQERKYNDLKTKALQNLSISKDKFLIDLCDGVYSTSDAIKHASELGIDIIASYYFIVIIESKQLRSIDTDWIKEGYTCLTFWKNTKEKVFIFQGTSLDQLEQAATNIRKKMQSREESICFGIGKIENRIQGISLSYAEAQEEKSYARIIYKYNKQATGDDLQSKKELHHSFNRKELIQFLKFGNIGQIKEFSKSYSSYLQTSTIHSPLLYYYFLMDFTITITHFIKEMDNDSGDVLGQIKDKEMRASWIREYQEVITYMEEVLSIVIGSRDQTNSKYGTIIQKTKEYILENFADPKLSLQTSAAKVNVSASYLSHMFSNETGQTLTEFLTNTRIERAKELLKTTNDKTYEIAYKVGYSDSHYFCHSFKKVTGMTTKAFKNSGEIIPIK
ncbi:response regulator [Aquibacillus kalidii]|uniref:response regulator n=1 Tax=Aquibacillus kalidii TaxID=2762597 RepID=UPI0016449C3B|nr:response regulator [Aquibacillus kalidii]